MISQNDIILSKDILYHVSINNINNKTINPTIPMNYMTKNGYEDNKTRRVCFSTSISGCLRAMSMNLKGMELYVYRPDKKYEVYKPSIKEVPDSKLTGEVWIKEPVKMIFVCKIKVTEAIDKPLRYEYGGHIAELYDWKYKIIRK